MKRDTVKKFEGTCVLVKIKYKSVGAGFIVAFDVFVREEYINKTN
jgi:hypothetical protein